MTPIISAILVIYFILYTSSTVGTRFYGNIGDVVFLAIALPVMFIPSRKKLVVWVRRARSTYLKIGRMLVLFSAYFILLVCLTYIPIELRTISSIKVIRPVIKSNSKLQPIHRVIVLAYDKPNADVLVISGDVGIHRKYLLRLEYSNRNWNIADIEEIPPKYRTFPPY